MAILSAFHGDPTQRSTALQRLADHIAANHLTGGPMAWDGVKGSIVGGLIHSKDPQVWVERLGLAKWLAHAIDAVTAHLPPPLALQKTTEMLYAIAPGRDTGPLGSELIGRLLGEMAVEQADSLSEPLRTSLEQVITLHRNHLAGEAIDAARWKAVRSAALAATDGFDEALQPRERALGAIIEAAAWDPQQSTLVVADVLRQWLGLERLKSDGEFGWTEADDANIRRLLARMHEDFKEPFPDEPRDVFQLLEEHHPEDAARLRAYMKFGRDQGTVCAERAASLLTRLLGSDS
jgi:hypothetical protein